MRRVTTNPTPTANLRMRARRATADSAAVRHDRSQTAFVICGLLFRMSRCMTDEEPRYAKTVLARTMKGAVHELGILAAAKLGPKAERRVKPAELRQ